MFNGAGRTQAQIEALELTGIYPEYDAIVPTLRAEIDHSRLQRDARSIPARAPFAEIRVRFDTMLPPRLALSGTLRFGGRGACCGT